MIIYEKPDEEEDHTPPSQLQRPQTPDPRSQIHLTGKTDQIMRFALATTGLKPFSSLASFPRIVPHGFQRYKPFSSLAI